MPELNKKTHIDVEVSDKEYICNIAYEDWEKEHGLMGVDNLAENEGMLFIYNEPQEEISFWMKNTFIDLDIVFICPCFKVLSVHKGIAESTDLITENNVQFVLEVAANSGVKEGDEVDFDGLEDFLEDKIKHFNKAPRKFKDNKKDEDEEDLKNDEDEDKEDEEPDEKTKIEALLKVLDPDGEVQLTLKGGERIFSRSNTKILIKQAKKADKLKTDSAYKRLGKSIFKYMKIQDENGEEYVEPKK